ncbi:MAG: macro domain-containing protein [Parcubacteria group bacterium]|jgi:hypothetical protein
MIKRWLKKNRLNEIGTTLISLLTVFWLLVEVTSYFTDNKSDFYFKNAFVYIFSLSIFATLSFWLNRPVSSRTEKIKDRDNFVELKVGDAFDNKGALVIPFNNYLDVSLNGNVAKAGSLQNRLIVDYYDNKSEHLDLDINKTHKTNIEHEIGTVVEVEKNYKLFYLLVNTRKQENNRVKSEDGDLQKSLISLWDYIANDSCRNDVVTIPIINAGHGRTPEQKKDILKKIIYSYIKSSQKLNICNKLIVSIPEIYIDNGIIKLEEVFEYLRYVCNHFIADEVDMSIPEKDATSKPLN